MTYKQWINSFMNQAVFMYLTGRTLTLSGFSLFTNPSLFLSSGLRITFNLRGSIRLPLINQLACNATKLVNLRAFILLKNILKKSGELSSTMKIKTGHLYS